MSREVRRTQAIDRFKSLQKDLLPVELELWDQRELSMKLKGAPLIVIEYFGNDIAERFCHPFVVGTTMVPSQDVVAVREAIARTPEVTTGADAKITEANECADADPETALRLVEEAQALLIDAGFAGHSARYDDLRATLSVATGRGITATRRRLDQLWIALDQGQSSLANSATNDIRKLAGHVNRKASRDHLAVAEAAVWLYDNPAGSVPELRDLLIGEPNDRARLGALAGETALANGDQEWLSRHATRLRQLSERVDGLAAEDALRVRLRVLAAEGNGDWSPILSDARSLRITYDLAALVGARHARHLALQQRFEEADAAWNEASGSACLAARWTDAARWVFSQRVFRTRWNPFTSDSLYPVQTALLNRGPDATVLPRDEDALEYAHDRFASNKLRPAAIAAQRALRDAVTLSDWEGERSARRVLAAILAASGEPEHAAHLLVLAGETTALKELAAGQPNRFLDVTGHLGATPYWIAGAAFRLIAEQADLIPDALVAEVADNALRDLEAGGAGTLVDLVGFAGSRYLGAIAAVAGIANRLDEARAERVLSHFESQGPINANQYRYHDADEARAVAGILTAHPSLKERALPHLVALLGRSEISRKSAAHDAVTAQVDLARPYLIDMAEQGNHWAQELLAIDQPDHVERADAEAALARLETPLVHIPGVVTVGTDALHDSTLARTLPARVQQSALEELINRGGDPQVSASDRRAYLLAGANLLSPPSKAIRSRLMEGALVLAVSPPASEADAADAQLAHPLGAFRIIGAQDSRAQAAYLAAGLARTVRDRERVRAATLNLVGDDLVSEYWTTRAVQALGDAMAPDVGFLSGQGWAMKSLAAILWAKVTDPGPVGDRLAADPDVRVRRALASALTLNQTNDEAADMHSTEVSETRRESREMLLEQLRNDPCFSVRQAAT